MSENSADTRLPFSFKIRRFLDHLQYGDYHVQPISREGADELYRKLEKKCLNKKEGWLLGEHERAEFYEQNKSSGQVLVIASGYDGIPSRIFGEANVVMVSLETSHYFSPYLTYLAKTENTPKIGADMLTLPFKYGSFSTLLINGMDVFNEKFIQGVSPVKSGTVREFFMKARRLTKTGGIFIITTDKQMEKPTLVQLKELEELGWKLSYHRKTPVLESYKLIAI